MSDGLTFTLILLSVLLASIGLPIIFIYFHDILFFCMNMKESFVDVVKSPFEIYKHNKQMKCIHLWRRLDAEYKQTGTLYRYRCENCGSGKWLSERESKLFEKDFMSDW